ncbi:Arc family DNA-binding protein [Crocosphaera sp. XPORK-15E]|uniref:Arc family DNA-binding protein n=1 Tax=Crocosphaera sp. XPORK-15E TaxID=3110247 RepID=UPI002B1FF83C|nr:Arc family DNA-binding protein [Crocosphaera sp. XPORK-15E]MEA5533745.1 Arc family DNA-binding protein [Crocosphaera sp. XPORK-15E]
MATNTKNINTQVTLPTELYQAIQKRAEKQGHSLNDEIVTLLMTYFLEPVTAFEDTQTTTSETAWAKIDEARNRHTGQSFSDSAELLREDRQR